MTSRARPAGPVLVAVAASVVLLVPVAAPASASCARAATPRSLQAQAGDVVLGVAEEVQGHRALLEVEEVWSGPDRAPRIRVVTGETRPGAATSVDVELVAGDRYLVSLQGDRTCLCSVLVVGEGAPVATRTAAAQVEAARPAGARSPVEGADAGDTPGPPLAAVAAGVLGWAAITALVLLAGSRLRRHHHRRRRRADGGRRPLR